MKLRIFSPIIIVLFILVSCAAPQPREDHVESTKEEDLESGLLYEEPPSSAIMSGSFIIYGQDWAFKIHVPEGWMLHWEDAFRYKVNSYFTRGSGTFDTASEMIAFYFTRDNKLNLSNYVSRDIEEYYEKYPGVKIREFEFENPDKTHPEAPASNKDREFVLIEYDFSEAEIEGADTYHHVIFFSPEKGSNFICVLQLSSKNAEGKKFLPDLQTVFLTIEKVDRDEVIRNKR